MLPVTVTSHEIYILELLLRICRNDIDRHCVRVAVVSTHGSLDAEVHFLAFKRCCAEGIYESIVHVLIVYHGGCSSDTAADRSLDAF